MSKSVHSILCAGIAVQDLVFRLDQFPPRGLKTRARDYSVVSGGNAANAAVAVARLGGMARFAGPIGGPAGEDLIGDRVLDSLIREHVDVSGVMRIDGAPSSLSAIFVEEAGERTIVNYRDDRLTQVRHPDPDALLNDVKAVLADNRYAEFVRPFCEAARRRGLPVILDGDRPTEASDALLVCATHLIFSAEGLRATARVDDLGAALRSLASAVPGFLAVTDGANGAFWLDGNTVRHHPAFEVQVVDTLAAGDVFHAAFALALTEGRAIADAMRFSTAAAAVKCMRFGGSAASPTRADVEAFLAASGVR